MKHIISKKFVSLIALWTTTVILGYASVYAWNGLTASTGDSLTAAKWNELVDKVAWIHTDVDWKVGIGIETPLSLLHLKGTSVGNTRLLIDANGTWKDPELFVDGDWNRTRRLGFKTWGLTRWTLNTNSTWEWGSNSGSNFAIYRYNDSGAYVGQPFFIERSTGNVWIWTTSPISTLHVSSTATNLRIEDSDSAIGVDGHYARTILSDKDDAITGWYGFATTGQMMWIANLNTGADAWISFQTVWGERLRISEGGNIGIGVSWNANARLEIYANDNTTSAAKFKNFWWSATALEVYAWDQWAETKPIFTWGDKNEVGLWAIIENGNFWIGTVIPTAKLEVHPVNTIDTGPTWVAIARFKRGAWWDNNISIYGNWGGNYIVAEDINNNWNSKPLFLMTENNMDIVLSPDGTGGVKMTSLAWSHAGGSVYVCADTNGVIYGSETACP